MAYNTIQSPNENNKNKKIKYRILWLILSLVG